MIKNKDFYNVAKHKFDLKILAGEKGMESAVRWLYMSEDKNSLDFLRGGELGVTTGMAINDTKALYDFILALIERNVVGLIVNTGKYISSEHITANIRELCNEKNFLLVEMPWEKHIADLMQLFGDMNFKDRQKTEELAAAFEAFCRGIGGEVHKQTLERYGYKDSDNYCVGLAGSEVEKHIYINDRIYVRGNRIIFHNMSYNDIENAAADFNVSIGTGICTAGFKNLGISNKRAERALVLALYKQVRLVAYKPGDIYSFFMDIESPDSIDSFYKAVLGAVCEYDKKHGSDMLKTLMAYIKYRGSIKAVAEEINCHRNTVSYRVEQLKELLNNDLQDGEYLSRVMLAGAALEYERAMKMNHN